MDKSDRLKDAEDAISRWRWWAFLWFLLFVVQTVWILTECFA